MSAIHAISEDARRILLEVMVAMAWADHELVEEERAAVRAAATALGLVQPPDAALASPDRTPVPIADIVVSHLGSRDRELIYLCAAWMAMADEVEVPAETRLLDVLQAHLELADDRAEWLGGRAVGLRREQTPDGSWWRAFDRLVVSAAKSLASG